MVSYGRNGLGDLIGRNLEFGTEDGMAYRKPIVDIILKLIQIGLSAYSPKLFLDFIFIDSLPLYFSFMVIYYILALLCFFIGPPSSLRILLVERFLVVGWRTVPNAAPRHLADLSGNGDILYLRFLGFLPLFFAVNACLEARCSAADLLASRAAALLLAAVLLL